MNSKGMDIEPGTDEYKIFMRRILWEEYPELTNEGSTFVDKTEEIDYILVYAWKHSGYKEMYGNYREPEEKEAVPPENR